ncbi:MmcQ/YjbR family DNA-binding protein [Labilithrix luteola]|uniref:MmcQ/YjbR family DNA-binding protein n=1 Tax=Labilithrix luteola TaxID=1391654 RepID=UPI0011BAB2FF|nr:MmcQ/YjbR family DNA-binding protein [Labilithrix luteola]
MTPARFKKLALSLEGVTERPHMDRTAFRTSRKIFATLGADKRVNLVVHPSDRRDALLESFPDTFFSLGGWTRLGYIAVDLARVDDELLRELVTDAWRDALPVAKTRKKAARKR